MTTITDVQVNLQTLTNKKITYTDIGNVLGTGKSNISLRAKNNSQVTEKEIKLLEQAYNVSLQPKKLTPETINNITEQVMELKNYIETSQKNFEKELKEIKNGSISIVESSNEDCIMLPVRGNLSASLGYGIEIIDETQTAEYPTPNGLIRALGLNKTKSEYISAEGDSMEPTISGGSLLLVDHTRKDIIDGKIYCVRLNNKLMAKRLQFLPPNKVKVISDNQEKYDPFTVNLSKQLDFDFAIIGEVRWWGTIAR